MSISYYLYRLGGMIVPQISPPIGYALCRLLGRFLYQFNKTGRANIQQNLQYILGPQSSAADIERHCRQTFNYILYNYFDLFRLPALDDETVNQLVTVEGWQHIEAALTEHKGIVITSAHLGNIEVVLYAMLLRGLKITIPVERVSPPKLFDYISALRSSKGLKLIPVDASLMALVRTLKQGGVAGLAGDRDITNSGQVINFFGHPAYLPDGHVRLALSSGAPLVLGFSRRNPDQTYHAYFLPPFYIPKHGPKEENIAAGIQYVLAGIEKAIKQNPEQWAITASIWVNDNTDPNKKS